MSEAHKQVCMSLQAFATHENLTKSQALYLAKRGRIMGAQKSRRGDWLVFPPAKLTEPLRKRTTWRDRDSADSAPAVSELPTERPNHRAVPLSGTGVMADSCHADTHPTRKDFKPAVPTLVDALMGFSAVRESEERSSEAPRLSRFASAEVLP